MPQSLHGVSFSLLSRQPTDEVSQKPSSNLPLLSARPGVTFPASELHHFWLVPVSLLLGEQRHMRVNDLPLATV